MLFRRFESFIDPFRPAPDVTPPAGLLAFYWHFIRQVWPVFLALLVVGFFTTMIEVALFSYLGRVVDLAQQSSAEHFFSEHAGELLWMGCVALLLRPPVIVVHDLQVHLTISPSTTLPHITHDRRRAR